MPTCGSGFSGGRLRAFNSLFEMPKTEWRINGTAVAPFNSLFEMRGIRQDTGADAEGGFQFSI